MLTAASRFRVLASAPVQAVPSKCMTEVHDKVLPCVDHGADATSIALGNIALQIQ
jgi:hypothetical protein